MIGGSPTPEFAVMVAEQCAFLLSRLDDDLRPVALAKMQDLTNQDLYVRGRGPVPPAVLDLTGKTVEGLACEPTTDYIFYSAKPGPEPTSFRVRVPANVPAGDYMVDPGANTKNTDHPPDFLVQAASVISS